jgi:hypothetical protein
MVLRSARAMRPLAEMERWGMGSVLQELKKARLVMVWGARSVTI